MNSADAKLTEVFAPSGASNGALFPPISVFTHPGCNKSLTSFKHLTIHFEQDNQQLFDRVNQQEIDAAILREDIQTFDTLSHKICSSPLVIVGNPMLDTAELDEYIKQDAQEFLTNKSLKLIWQSDVYPLRDYYLIAHKKQNVLFEMLKKLLID